MRIDYPRAADAWIELPDVWLGLHAQRHDEALAKSKDLPATWREFVIAIALLDNWQLPGLTGRPETWDLGKMDLHVMAWVKSATLTSYYECFQVPKNS
jgi:hypothetical protein